MIRSMNALFSAAAPACGKQSSASKPVKTVRFGARINPELDARLLAAIEAQDALEVKKLLAQGADANAMKGDKTATSLAKGNREILMDLMAAGADVYARDEWVVPRSKSDK